jgi:hypothetical protein
LVYPPNFPKKKMLFLFIFSCFITIDKDSTLYYLYARERKQTYLQMGIEAEKLDSRGTYGGNYAQYLYDGRSFRGGECSNNEEWAEPPIEGMLKTCMMGGTFEGRNNRIAKNGGNLQ